MYRSKLWPTTSPFCLFLHGINLVHLGIAFSRTLPVFLREVSHLKLGLFENSTWCFKHPIECSILWHLCPFSFLSANNTLLSLFVSVCFVFVGGLIVVLNGCFLHGVFFIEFLVCSRWVRTVFYILLSTYQCSTHGAVKYWRYHSTMASTVQQYLHCSTSLFWLQYSWWCQVLGVPQYKVPWRLPYNSATTVLLFHPALSWCIVQYLQYSFIVVISLHFKGGVFPVVMLVGAFVSCLLSHIFFLLFCIPIRKIVTTSGVVCLNLFLCFNGIHASSACVLRLSV